MNERNAWGADAAPGRDPSATALLPLCAIAREPLTIADLRQLAADHFPSDESARSAAYNADGLISGDGTAGSGYTFANPSRRDRFLEHALDPNRRREWLGRFIDWGERAYRGRDVPAYLRRHWIAHLIQAGMVDRAADIVSRFDRIPKPGGGHGRIQRWQALRYGAEHQDLGYRSDLELVRTAIGREGSPGRFLRLDLIAASLQIRLDNITPELLEGLIRTGTTQGRWTKEMALGIIRASRPRRQGSLLAAALRAGVTLDRNELLDLLASIPWAGYFVRSHSFDEIASLLPESDLLAVAELAESLADRAERVTLLATLIPRIPPGPRNHPLEMLFRDRREANSYPIWSRAAPILAEFLPAGRLEEFVEHILQGDRGSVYYHHIISHLLRRGSTSIRDRVREESKQWPLPDKIDVLAALGTDLPRDERIRTFSEILDRISATNSAWIVLARAVPDELLEWAFERFRSLPHSPPAWRSVLAFSLRFPEPKRSELYRAARADFLATPKEQQSRSARNMLYESAPDSCIDELTGSVLSIEDPAERLDSAFGLIPHLSPGRREGFAAQVWEAYRDDPPRIFHPSALMEILKSIPTSLFPTACNDALAILGSRARSQLLPGIIHRFPLDQQPAWWGQCLDDALLVEDGAGRAKALALLVGRVPEGSAPAFMSKVTSALETVDDPADRSEALMTLASAIPEGQQAGFFAQALEAAAEPRRTPRQHHPLLKLCETAPEALLGRLRGAISNLQVPADRAESMIALAPRLPESDRDAVLAEALEDMFAPHQPRWATRPASQLFRILPESSFERAWELIQGIEYYDDLDRAFEALLVHLPNSMLDRVQADLPALQRRRHPSWGQTKLAERRLGREAARELFWARHLDFSSNAGFGFHELAQSTLGLAEGEKARRFAEALERVEGIQSEIGRPIALGWLIPRLPEDALDRALEIGLRLEAEWVDPFSPLLDLADRLPEDRRGPIYDHCIRSLSRQEHRVALIHRLRLIAERDDVGPEWPLLAEVIRLIAEAGRPLFLDGIASIATWLDGYLRAEDWLEFERALEDVACAWP